MALHHASSGEVIDLAVSSDQPGTRAIVKTDKFETIRLVLRQGDTIPAHRLASQITLHCLKGSVAVQIAGGTLMLDTDQWVFFDEDAVHGFDATTDAVLLMTIMLPITAPA